MKIRITPCRPLTENLSLTYATEGSAGFDLVAAIEEPIKLGPGDRETVPVGFRFCIPQGFEGQIRSRSGLAHHNGVCVLNSPGTIDSDYRGEVGVVLINHGETEFAVFPLMRIAQMVIAPVVRVELEVISGLDRTPRGEGGFGSSGTHSASQSAGVVSGSGQGAHPLGMTGTVESTSSSRTRPAGSGKAPTSKKSKAASAAGKGAKRAARRR